MSKPDRWLRADDIELDVRLPHKRTALEVLARRLAGRHGGNPQAVFDALWDRERLGSTALGHGVAVPHARLAGLNAPIGAFLRLERGIPFDAPDDKPVNLVIGLLLPQRDPQRQLHLLAYIAGLFSEARFREQVEQAADSQAAAALLGPGPRA
jgi:PTS system nitrogen regulatory IIA component